jgi:hypothetical protein
MLVCVLNGEYLSFYGYNWVGLACPQMETTGNRLGKPSRDSHRQVGPGGGGGAHPGGPAP